MQIVLFREILTRRVHRRASGERARERERERESSVKESRRGGRVLSELHKTID